ncbi:MAG: hypothetical protein AMXMBFR19_12850 [Chthonomonadaceae bacterium]|uniref:Prepilin-type N-terminal cleavage/methylation domain-containing protein n=1 Tax=Candidatus Nitrosymbiomonas proteolyticus TaxID=2608984 RepID=A0A809R4Y2_9BACT|nr:type II secretion system protein [Armatimonadota bacterium]BBO22653.1 conserved hypothetical protein [Candidatus Nitrosymbiomonas proteolyticus]
MRNFAFSLVEVLVCLAIAAVLVAILVPVFSAAKKASHESVCASNLKQLHLAVALYQEQYGGQGGFGNLFEMGLPLPPLRKSLRYATELGRCDGPGSPVRSPTGFAYFYIPSPPNAMSGFVKWADYVAAEGENAVLIMDLNHNQMPATSLILAEGLTKKGMAVLLSGQLVKKNKKGNPWKFDWWK